MEEHHDTKTLKNLRMYMRFSRDFPTLGHISTRSLHQITFSCHGFQVQRPVILCLASLLKGYSNLSKCYGHYFFQILFIDCFIG